MRLLDKKNVSIEVATEKKRQIDQGVQLAKKIDALRETKLSEEEQLALYRKQSIARVQLEIDEKLKERDSVAEQIRQRKSELRELRRPLDGEWQSVKEEKEINRQDRDSNYQRQMELEQGIALNIQRERLNKEEEQRVSSERERSVKALMEADLMRETAGDVLAKAKIKSDSIMDGATRRDETSSKREKAVEIREREVIKEASRLKKVEVAQRNKDREIADKYATLERTIKRYASK